MQKEGRRRGEEGPLLLLLSLVTVPRVWAYPLSARFREPPARLRRAGQLNHNSGSTIDFIVEYKLDTFSNINTQRLPQLQLLTAINTLPLNHLFKLL